MWLTRTGYAEESRAGTLDERLDFRIWDLYRFGLKTQAGCSRGEPLSKGGAVVRVEPFWHRGELHRL
jgi:hypothetical protein